MNKIDIPRLLPAFLAAFKPVIKAKNNKPPLYCMSKIRTDEDDFSASKQTIQRGTENWCETDGASCDPFRRTQSHLKGKSAGFQVV